MSQTIESWKANAKEWIHIVHTNSIPSRAITNPAIMATVLQSCHGKSVLDLGCGEGWLCRALQKEGLRTFGIDGTWDLIEAAKKQGLSDSFECLSFEEIIAWSKKKITYPLLDQLANQPFDGLIFNFCLYGDVDSEALLRAVQPLVRQDGKVYIQTLHPLAMLAMGLRYESQWMADAWKGLPGNFTNGHPWYARTLQDWMLLFRNSGFQLQQLLEPQGKELNQPSSIIFVLSSLPK
ncbi:class I SAM-dependent methyltransferase [Mongoliitalea daihaiensis]|uniref:class I SAM-dependent methyltransferase n=1 Tax=Mongoliitalea daihaiensis TaxID=2782006 RepID=UPI001F332AB8|nr:class I SAM-dependent methyltransferase [Mongoliitalea daihaiensis]UJP63780.1 class I SAM-dependent methyltransferase [Mongoliitalea daihaiensis]